MKCNDFYEYLSLYFDGELSSDEVNEMLDHMKDCDVCRQEYEDYEKIKCIFEEIEEVPLPEKGHEFIMSGIKAKEKRGSGFGNFAKKFNKKTGAIAAVVVIAVIAAAALNSGFLGRAFGAKASAPTEASYNYSYDQTAAEEVYFETEAVEMEAIEDGGFTVSGSPQDVKGKETVSLTSASEAKAVNDMSESAENERLIIKNLYTYIEVENYDEALNYIEDMTKKYGGYVQDSYTWDNLRYDGVSTKNGEITIRIPKEHYEDVKEGINGIGRVKEENETSSDITSQYVETEGRLSALRTEHERLLEILSECYTVEDLIAVEQRLSEVRADIEIYQNKINNWDRLVKLSTINISLYEKQPAKVSAQPNFSERVSESFIEGVNSFANGWQDFVVGFLGNILIIAVIAAIVIAVIKIVKKIKNKRRKGE